MIRKPRSSRHASRRGTWLAACALAGTLAAHADADLLYYEGFNYGSTADALTTAGAAGGWTGDAQIGYVPNSLAYANLQTTGGSAIGNTDDGTTYTVTNMFDESIATGPLGGQFYFSFLISMHETDIPAGNGEDGSLSFFVPQNPAPTSSDTSGARSIQVPWDSTNGTYNYNYSAMSGASTSHADTTMMVFYFPGGGDAIEYWINPDPLATAPLPGTGTSTGAAAYSNRITGVQFSARNLLLEVDEIRIGTTFEDVVVAVPEPASLALTAAGGLLCMRRPRRR